MNYRAITSLSLTVMLSAIGAGLSTMPAHATADGPDSWSVTGVASDDVLNIRFAPMATAPIIGTIPPDGRRLANLGCSTPTFAQWSAMSSKEQERSAKKRWCRIRYEGIEGWVRGRYLREGD